VSLLKHTGTPNGMGGAAALSAILRAVRRLVPLLVLIALAGCGSDDDPAPGSTSFLPGGRDAFEARVANQGKPVVVNKWASWCGPCRLEFPFFRKQAEKRKGEVVFIGVNSNDNRGDAEQFLEEEPVPFKHFEDPKLEIAASFNAVQAFPATAYYDSKGALAFVHQGPYRTERELAEAIDRYAR
jgi:cytochrome c biogenesis protein CcmG/thiol:disulfide interchange protein DsbE